MTARQGHVMNFVLLVVLYIVAVAALPPVRLDPSSSALQSSTRLQEEEIVSDIIRHGRRKKKGKIGHGRGKKRRKLKNASARRFVEKQYLVHNRTVSLLGDEVQKILLNTRTYAANLPYSEGNETRFSVLRKASDPHKAVYNSSSVVIGLKISQAREESSENGRVEDKVDFNYDLDISLFADELQINLGTAVAKLIGAVSSPTNAQIENSTPCEKLIDCRKHLQDIFLGPLPSCPCHYPTSIFYEDKIWDEPQKRFYRWKDASGDGERLDIYKPSAEYCIRSLLAHGSTTLAAQHCCYNRERKLITRGSGAGNPNYVSPDISRTLHEKIDLLPWKLCKGDFTRYNKMRPPNNGNMCEENPNNEEYEKQIRLASFY